VKESAMGKENWTGGPAFPTGTQVEQNNATGETTIHQYLSDGMSLRDYFAAKAMNGMYASDTEDWCLTESYGVDLRAKDAYKMADAMLKARES